MRRQIWIPCVVLAMIGVLLLLHRANRREPTNAPSTNPTSDVSAVQVAEPKMSTMSNHGTSSSALIAPTLDPTQHTIALDSNTYWQTVLGDWQVPIDFYGKVVDENSNAVAGVNIRFRWMKTPHDEDTETTSTQSDSDGFFSLRGKRGARLRVWFGKDGYWSSSGGQRGFSYALSPNIHSPDPENPVVFHLRKMGEQAFLVTKEFPAGMGHIAQLRTNGTPTEIDLLSGQEVSAGSGQLRLGFWRGVIDKTNPRFDWKLQLSIPNGGLSPAVEEFAFQAPESGYSSVVVIEMPATNQLWLGEIRSKYYIHLPDGRFGRIDLYLLPYNGVITVQSTINPSGSRNLEPAH